MIDATNLKSPGWQRVVAELIGPANDDATYMRRLLRVISQVCASSQGVLYVPSRGEGDMVEPRVALIWPGPGEGTDAPSEGGGEAATNPAEATIESPTESKIAARAVFESGQSRLYSLERQDVYYESAHNKHGYILAVPLHQHVSGGAEAGAMQVAVMGVICLLLEPRSREAVRSTTAMAEVIAGYMHAHAARQHLRRVQHAGEALDLGTKLIGAINSARNFRGACIQLVNDLSRQYQADRVSLGWVERDATRVKAISDVEHFSRQTQMVQKIAHAMDECLDQEQPVVFPVPSSSGPEADVLLSQAIVHAHRELAAGAAQARVCSLPLRADEDVIGVITVETTGGAEPGGFTPGMVETLQAALDLVSPVLKIRRSDDRNIVQRSWHDMVRAGEWAVGPRHTLWKVAGIAVIATLAFVTFYQTTYRPGADATVEPRVRRIVSAPFDGIVKRLGEGVDSGKVVREGDVLVELDVTEWRLRLIEAEAKIAQAQTQAAAARSARQHNKVMEAEQQETQAHAEADALRDRIARSTITAPISGTIIAGDLTDRIGGTIKLGDQIFQIADLSDVLITAHVDERDIALVKAAVDDARGTGEFATKGRPEIGFNFRVERVVPLASAIDGKNVFEVRAKLDHAADWFRPGMEGIAKFDTERMSLLRIGTRRLIDQARMWLWWW